MKNLIQNLTALLEQHTSISPSIREIAAVDLGSNSFHMIIARIINGNIQILSRLKQKVQLAKGLDSQGVLNQAAIMRGVNCLALFGERLKDFSPENVYVVGTYTLRSAVNNGEFLRQAKAVFPFPINIVAGETEARLIYAGVSHTQPESGRKLVVDIGGGSTEMIIGDHFDPLIANSRNMGCVSFAESFFQNGELSKSRFEQARQTALSRIIDLAEPYKTLGWQYVLGSSGTIKSVQQVITAMVSADGVITAERLNVLIEHILQFSHFDQLKIAGLTDERADVFVPGLAILSAVFEVFGIEKMRYSDGALREGLMYGLDQHFQVMDIRQRTVAGLTLQFNLDQRQAVRVAQTAMTLAQQVQTWESHEIAEDMQNILFYAAWLHEVGLVVNHKNMQKHSAYILANVDLPGFNKEQQRLLATLVRHHIHHFNPKDIGNLGQFHTQDVYTLIRLLRLAVLLNKSRQATPSCAKMLLNTDHVLWTLDFGDDSLAYNPLIQNELQTEQKILADVGFGLTW